MLSHLWAAHGLILFSIVLASDSQYRSSSPSDGRSFTKPSFNRSSVYSSSFLSSAASGKVSSLSTDSTCFIIRTFSSLSSSSSRCCGACSIVYPDVQILHWPVIRTNTWCDSIKADLSRNPLSTVAPGPGPPLSGAVVDYRNVSTSGFAQSLLTQGPAIIYESIDNSGNVIKATTSTIGRMDSHITRPPTNGSYSIDENGFVYVSPSIYVVIPYVIATDDCAPVPPIWTSVILAYPEGKVLTRWNPDFPAAFLNPADLGCPPEYNYLLTQPGNNGVIQTSTDTEGRFTIPDQITSPGGLDNLKVYIAEYTPSLLADVQYTIAQMLPQWKHCVAYNQNSAFPFGRDPPRVIQPMGALAGPTTANEDQPVATGGPELPQAKSVPPSPIPAATPSPNKPESQGSPAPPFNDPPQGDTNTAGNVVPKSSAALLQPTSIVGADSQTQDSPSGPADPTQGAQIIPPASPGHDEPAQNNPAVPSGSNNRNQNYPPNSPNSSQEAQDSPAKPSDPSKATQVLSPYPLDPPGITQSGPIPSTGASPANNLPGPGLNAASVQPAESPESLANAPAFAQFDPKPVETGGVNEGAATGNAANPAETGGANGGAATGNAASPGDTPPNPVSQQGGAATPGIGAYVNAAMNGLISGPVSSPSSNVAAAALISALQISADSNPGSAGVSYSRSFNLESSPQATGVADAPTRSPTGGFLQIPNNGSQLLSSLPALVVDSSAAGASTAIQDGLSNSFTSQSGGTATGAQNSNLATGSSGTAKTTFTSRASIVKRGGYGLWKIWAIVAFALTLCN